MLVSSSTFILRPVFVRVFAIRLMITSGDTSGRDHRRIKRAMARGNLTPRLSQIPDVTVSRHLARVIQLVIRFASRTSGRRVLVVSFDPTQPLQYQPSARTEVVYISVGPNE